MRHHPIRLALFTVLGAGALMTPARAGVAQQAEQDAPEVTVYKSPT